MVGIKMLGGFLFSLMISQGLAQTDSMVSFHHETSELQMRLNPEILSNETVQKHLNSGLTTTFFFECRLNAGQRDEETHVLALALRFELWEEVFFVKVFNAEGILVSEKLERWNGLTQWWQQVRLKLGSISAHPTSYRLMVEVIPFSAQEREAAAAWVSQSLGQGTTQGSAEANDLGARILSTIVATSFKRRVLQSFTYKGKLATRSQ